MHIILTTVTALFFFSCNAEQLPLYYWQQPNFVNFGDYISLKLVEKIVGEDVVVARSKQEEKKLLAIGSILSFAKNGDVIWGTGVNGKLLKKSDYNFTHLDVRAIRGPLTRAFLSELFLIKSPEIYGDPALLFPYFFPEFKRKKNPQFDYIVIPHYTEKYLFTRQLSGNVVYPTDPWNQIIEKILDSKFVISSSLHGIIIAEAYGIPARLLKITENEPLLKYEDYYFGTGRPYFQYANSVEEALLMGGEQPFQCDLEKLYDAFPFDYWPNTQFKKPLLLMKDKCSVH